MAKKNKDYWQERFLAIEKRGHLKAKVAQNEFDDIFKRAYRDIYSDLATFYEKFANNNRISLQEAQRMLTSNELAEFKWDLKEYTRKAKALQFATGDDDLKKQVENASLRARISRINALKTKMDIVFNNLAKELESGMSTALTDIYSDIRLRTAYEIARGVGDYGMFANIDQGSVEALLKKPWTRDDKTFSDRIWENKEKLVDNVQKELTRGLITGADPSKAIKGLAEAMNVNKRQAGRLIMTESAYIASKAQEDMYKESGFDKYRIVATLDHKTSEVCQSLDGTVLEMKNYEVGVTAPPFHPNCRTTTVPYVDDITERVGRDWDGKELHVSNDIAYKDWHEKYVQPNPDASLLEKKLRNESSDKRQFEKYKAVLGKAAPRSLAEFQKMKYTDSDKWETTKLSYKNENLRNKIREEYNLTLREGMQGKHIKGHNNYKGGSYFLETITMDDLKKLAEKYMLTGRFPRNTTGRWSNNRSEIIEIDSKIGYDVAEDSKIKIATNRFSIHYSKKKGIHLVPRIPSKGDK